jgi:hypothetical protein
MFRALLAHLQEALHKQLRAYYVGWLVPGLECHSIIVYTAPPADEQVVLD